MARIKHEPYEAGYLCDVPEIGDYILAPVTVLDNRYTVGKNCVTPVVTKRHSSWFYRHCSEIRHQEKVRLGVVAPPDMHKAITYRTFGVDERGNFHFGAHRIMLVPKGPDDKRITECHRVDLIREDDEIELSFYHPIASNKFKLGPIRVFP